MARWEGFEGIVDFVFITGTDSSIVHDEVETISSFLLSSDWDIGFADGEEMRSETTNKPFEENLEDGGADERVEKSNDCVVHIPERSNADLDNEEGGDGNERGEERGFPDRNNFIAERLDWFILDLICYNFHQMIGRDNVLTYAN